MTRRRDPEGRETRHLLDFVDLHGKHVIDIGAGAGFTIRRYAAQAVTVVALDPNLDSLKEAVQEQAAEPRGKVRQVVGWGQELPLQSSSGDVAIYSWSY